MMVIQKAFKVFVIDRPHRGSMVCCSWPAPAHVVAVVARARSYLNSIYVLSTPIQVVYLITVANAYLNSILVVFVVLDHYATTSHFSLF